MPVRGSNQPTERGHGIGHSMLCPYMVSRSAGNHTGTTCNRAGVLPSGSAPSSRTSIVWLRLTP